MRYIEITEAARKLTFYHGGNNRIESFSLEHLGTGLGHDQHGPGIYLTSSPQDAARYGKYVHTVEVDIPRSRFLGKRKISRQQVADLIEKAPDFEDRLTNWNENPRTAFKNATDNIFSSYHDDMRQACEQIWFDFYYPDHTVDYLRHMIEIGYDAFTVNLGEPWYEADTVHMIVYNPACLKIVSVQEPVTEQMLTATPWYGDKKPFFVYKNPTVEEYDRAIGDNDQLRAFVKGNDLYVWKTGAGIHAVVYEQLKLTDAIPLYMYAYMGGPCAVMVTDCIERTKWSRNKSKVAAAILKCGFLREHFKKIVISYYDEGIVGDWKNLPSF